MAALRVLVVEDEMLIGMLLADMLEARGYDVCAVEATETGAVTAAARYNPGLMIVDARLRDGSGVAAHTSKQMFAPNFSGHLRRDRMVISGDTFVELVRPDDRCAIATFLRMYRCEYLGIRTCLRYINPPFITSSLLPVVRGS